MLPALPGAPEVAGETLNFAHLSPFSLHPPTRHPRAPPPGLGTWGPHSDASAEDPSGFSPSTPFPAILNTPLPSVSTPRLFALPSPRGIQLPIPGTPAPPQSPAHGHSQQSHSGGADGQAASCVTRTHGVDPPMWSTTCEVHRCLTEHKHPSSPLPKGNTKATQNFKTRQHWTSEREPGTTKTSAHRRKER